MNTVSKHIQDAELLAYAMGHRGDSSLCDRVEAHLEDCDACAQAFVLICEQQSVDNKLLRDMHSACQGGTTASTHPLSTPTGMPSAPRIDGYELLGEIHRGGQGVVYKALQKATKRIVAVKCLLQASLASERQRHRFEREIHTVASLQHPYIVTVFDSGVTDEGLHFFALEYVRGASLLDFCREGRLTLSERLTLMQKICAGVSHAHMHGVIHRDLKPSNIQIDSNRDPRILDFGLAKVAGGTVLGGDVPLSMTGEFLGTLAYASPEQAMGDPSQVDVRTDIYSLGVVFYEMLTGHNPYVVKGRVDEVLRAIVETPPVPPSSRNRRTSSDDSFASGLQFRIDRDLETIVLKMLAKQRERRYQSIDDVAREIGHYIAREPIEARRDSATYVLCKVLGRHRGSLAAGMIGMVLICVGLVSCAHLYKMAHEAIGPIADIGFRIEYAPKSSLPVEFWSAHDDLRALSGLSPVSHIPVVSVGHILLHRDPSGEGDELDVKGIGWCTEMYSGSDETRQSLTWPFQIEAGQASAQPGTSQNESTRFAIAIVAKGPLEGYVIDAFLELRGNTLLSKSVEVSFGGHTIGRLIFEDSSSGRLALRVGDAGNPFWRNPPLVDWVGPG